MRVALVSLDQSWENKTENQQKISAQLECLAGKNVDWAIFPEMTLTGFTMNAFQHAEDADNSPTIEFFRNCAKSHRIYIGFGIILNSPENPLNCLVIVSPEGEIIANYPKIHPFSFAREDQFFSPGKKIVTASIHGIEVGLSVCYDLRFPEIYQAMSRKCRIIVNIANWPQKRVNHWRILSQARAIENQVFFIGVNRIGTDHNGFFYEKSSMIISPEGTVLSPQFQDSQLDIYEIDPGKADEYRQSFPVKSDRRNALYKEFLS